MKIFIAGHRGMVGSAILRHLASRHEAADLLTRSRTELDLLDTAAVEAFFATQRPQQVYLAAAKVGGIWANNHQPAEFIYQNLMVEANIIHAAWRHGVERLLFLGSSCIYPRMAPQPMLESALLTGPLEPTNEPYAVAKIAGIKLCESYNRQYETDFRSAMPTNLYGPGDNFNLRESHVIPALLRKFHQAKLDQAPEVEVWGSGAARREFLHVDDMAAACVYLMELPFEQYAALTDPMCSHVNVGSGEDLPIRDLAALVKQVTGYPGRIRFDASQPDGPPRKLLDVSRLNRLGWHARITLEAGLTQTYQWFLDNQHQLRD
ncbi:GDP-L-fucose synthase [Rhabdochromatium marinum]|uniref:GDP-L-fucose synthase n=1 Tax=Rhabdochromatium marinum TaxID=48729 RepID=UPI003B82ECBD